MACNRLALTVALVLTLSVFRGYALTSEEVVEPLPGTAKSCTGWRSLYYLHVPKAGGTFLRTHLQTLARLSANRSPLKWCDSLKTTPHAPNHGYNCHASLEAGRKYREPWVRPFLDGKCNFTSSHNDYGIVDVLTRGGEDTVMLVVSLRDPLERLYSHWQHMARVAKAAGQPNLTVEAFLSTSPDHHNLMTKMLAGNLGCITERKQYPDPEDMLVEAKSHLREVCAITIRDRFDESLEYLGWVLGVDPAKTKQWASTDEKVNGGNYRTSESDLKKLKSANTLDQRLYEYALGLFDDKLAAMRLHKARAEVAATI